MRILIVRFSSMGDVILQTSLVNWLALQDYPKIKISFVTSEEFKDLLIGHPNIQEVITFNRKQSSESFADLIKKIKLSHKKNPYSLILDAHGSLRSFRLRLELFYIPSLVIDKRRWMRTMWSHRFNLLKKWLLPQKNNPQVYRSLNDLKWIFNDDQALSDAVKLNQMKILTSLVLKNEDSELFQGKYLVLAPGGSFPQKKWSIESFYNLALWFISLEKFKNYSLVILAGPEDKECDVFNKITNSRVINLQGKTTLLQTMSWISKAQLVVGNDSGLNHMAEAFLVKVLTMFGPTHQVFGFAPHGAFSQTLSVSLWCRPCSTLGNKKCFRKKIYCQELITLKMVQDKVITLLETT